MPMAIACADMAIAMVAAMMYLFIVSYVFALSVMQCVYVSMCGGEGRLFFPRQVNIVNVQRAAHRTLEVGALEA